MFLANLLVITTMLGARIYMCTQVATYTDVHVVLFHMALLV